jgi:TIR domain
MTDAASHQHAMKLFYSYAPADESLRKELEDHLALLQRQGYISGWHHGSIGAGSDWQEETTAQLNAAQIILLLISASFMASDFCYGTEMTRALQRHAAGEARIIPILLRPCDWQNAPFSHLQPLPANKTPITKWPDRDEAFLYQIRLSTVQRSRPPMETGRSTNEGGLGLHPTATLNLNLLQGIESGKAAIG